MFRKHEVFKKKFVCPYPGCRWIFEKEVGKGYTGGSSSDNSHCVSDQVKCPCCGNFLKTWE